MLTRAGAVRADLNRGGDLVALIVLRAYGVQSVDVDDGNQQRGFVLGDLVLLQPGNGEVHREAIAAKAIDHYFSDGSRERRNVGLDSLSPNRNPNRSPNRSRSQSRSPPQSPGAVTVAAHAARIVVTGAKPRAGAVRAGAQRMMTTRTAPRKARRARGSAAPAAAAAVSR